MLRQRGTVRSVSTILSRFAGASEDEPENVSSVRLDAFPCAASAATDSDGNVLLRKPLPGLVEFRHKFGLHIAEGKHDRTFVKERKASGGERLTK